MHTMKRKRLLEDMGFAHVSGWVHKKDAPAIRAKIKAAKADVENAKATETATRVAHATIFSDNPVETKEKK